MKYSFTMFKTSLIGGMQYRAAAWAGIATQFFWGFMQIMIFEAFYSHSNAPMPMSFEQLCTYVWLQQAFLGLIELWSRDSVLFDMITNGNVAYEFCRPNNIYAMWYARLLGARLSRATLRFAPVLILSLLLPSPYKLLMPTSLAQVILVLISLCMACMLTTALSMLAYILTFKTMSPLGSMTLLSVVGEFFSGSLIPIPYMPNTLQKIAYALPFRYYADLPFRLYNGSIGVSDGAVQICVSMLWLIVLIAAGALWMHQVSKKLVVQGG